MLFITLAAFNIYLCLFVRKQNFSMDLNDIFRVVGPTDTDLPFAYPGNILLPCQRYAVSECLSILVAIFIYIVPVR